MPKKSMLHPMQEHNYELDIAEFSDKVRSIRKNTGLSLDDLARRLESDKSPLSKIESGRRIPKLDMVFRIADAMNVPASVLLPDRFLLRNGDAEWSDLYHLYTCLPESERETAVRYIRAMLTGLISQDEK